MFFFAWIMCAHFAMTKSQNIACRAADGYAGNCTRLGDCAPLLRLSRSRQPTREQSEYLRRSACGLLNDGTPKVCCSSAWETRTILGSGAAAREPSTPASERAPTTPDAAPASVESGDCPPTVAPPARDCCGRDAGGSGNRIVGGNATGIDEYPWLALIEYHRELVYPDRVVTSVETSCGGSLLSARYVLTAAHCVTTPWTKPTNVRLAEYNTTSSPEDCVETDGGGWDCTTVVVIPIERSIAHPDYLPDDPVRANDIGLFKLKYNAPYTDFIRPICLPTFDLSSSPGANHTLLVAGWGSDGVAFSEVKRHVRVPFVSLARCRSIYGGVKNASRITDKQICAGGEQGKDSCTGDSGGPLMLATPDGGFAVSGVVSVGPRVCGTRGLPAVYTNVFKFNKWIVDNMIP